VISRPDDSEPNLIDRLEAFLATGEDLPLAPKSHREMWRDEQTEWERNFASDSVAHRFPENSFGDFTEPHDREIRSRDTAHLMYPPNRPPRQEQPGRESIPDPRRKRLNPDAERGYTGRRRRGGVSRDSEAIAPQVEPRESEIYETFATLHLPRDFDDLAMGEAPDDVVDPMSHTPRTSQEEVIRADILTDDTGKPSIGIGALRDTRVTPAVTSKAKTKKPKKYRLPSLDLLELPKEDAADTKEHTQSIAKKLETTLRSFHVDAEVRSFKRGPAITMFEVVLSPGVKMSKVQGLADDIALSLAASQVRIAPIAGKSAVGIEVPNKTSSMVRLREIIDVPEFKSSKSKLTMALGKDIAGNPIVGDLASMPHLLIAGATGSGKSVCVNTIISSILFHAAPDEVQFLMIDPKIVELSGYNGIPHLIMPVVTDPKKASIALNWAVQEMERRYAAFSESRVKDIKSYNQKIEDARNAEVPDGEMHGEPMPQIVVIIDELADLMMAAPKQVEDSICRIAQKARAAGIHLIVATQRPSVDVITGLIKANIPSRIAFAVSSQVDSRTIIDMQGAEKLLGKGDMLYYPASAPKPKRVQGAFMTDQEVERMVAFASSQQIERNGEEIVLEESVSMESGEEEVDELLHEAIQFVLESGMASASLLQRKYRIGYNRAARLIDSMEERGIVGPSRGSKPREILTRHHDEL
ncbi:MAG: DNA translocase FtsK, partial [Bacillota bacterium]|nr:DNA translocase FtsK [Bacillota bacterium]